MCIDRHGYRLEAEATGHDVMKPDHFSLHKMRRAIQLVFQDPYPSPKPRLSIGRALVEFFMQHRFRTATEANDSTATRMEKIGLPPEIMRRVPHDFSGCQRQRIAIARALIFDSEVPMISSVRQRKLVDCRRE